MKTKDEVLIAYGVSTIQDGNDYLKYGVTLNKIRLAMQDYSSNQCQKRDELIKAQDELLKLQKESFVYEMTGEGSGLDWNTEFIPLANNLQDKIEQLKREIL
jgi:hypothetical protein